MVIVQSIYLGLNIVGVLVGLILICNTEKFPVVQTFFGFVEKYLGNIPLVIISILLITLFLPTIAIITAVLIFVLLWGSYSK